MNAQSINLTPHPEILEVIAEVDLQIHHCVAELIDNCLDELKSASNADPSLEPRIDITIPTSTKVRANSYVTVEDNGRGMNVAQLEEALRAGSSGKQMHGSLGMFGMGFNIATARLGGITRVRTGRRGDDKWVVATIDLRQMSEENSFEAPIRFEEKDPAQHGTLISVTRLKDDTVAKLSSSRAIRDVKTRLGRIYTFMLRDSNAGHSGAELMGGESLSIYVNNTAVSPYIPCIWDPSRKITYKGTDVPAATKIDIPMKPAYACMDCGKWHPNMPHDALCTACSAGAIEERARRIWGWIGVQRYADNNDFGFSFFRHGRCLVDNDQALFEWETPEGVREKEYPVELGKGRIVGEIHLDHAKPQVRKTDFDRESTDWKHMVEAVRGLGPLRPNIAKARGYTENASILGRYFNAFRRNDPGVASLMPGNGKSATHETAKEWAKHFRDGDPDYLTDERWFEAAEKHDRIKAGRSETADGGSDSYADPKDWFEQEGLGDLTSESTDESDSSANISSGDLITLLPKPETDDERFARYRESADLLPETNREIRIDGVKTTLRIYATRGVDLFGAGRKRQFAVRYVDGEIEVYIDERCSLLADFGWSPLDTALVCAAPDLQRIYRVDGSVDELVRDLLSQFPDRRVHASAIRDRAEAILERIRDRLVTIAKADSSAYWNTLSQESKRAAENSAILVASDINWSKCVESGEFTRYIGGEAILDLVMGSPELVLDGVVFRTTYAALGPETRMDQVARLSGLLVDLRRMLRGPQSPKILELQRFLLSAELLEAEVVSE
jgi:hypothetical protein